MNTAGERFVPTIAIKDAVSRRELEILAAVGINWHGGKKHIDCPYPDHGGKTDWRWDSRNNRAFCTCVGTRPGEKKSHSIFNVVMTMDGIDFDASKIKIAELLHRSDLIKTKRGGGTSQKMTAAALLYAPANRRDDSLPVRYLAHRLGVDVADVPVPATPMVGLQALAYYEPAPPGSPEKATSIGEFPCAVFGTVAADGGVHAMRVYLAPGGAGKAELGVDRDGNSRDPKKSATALANDTTGGRSVLWGDSAAAPHIVVTEGIETGAAVALALKAEIEAGEIAIAAAITAGGVEAFQPYPATKRVTIAADRDEALKPGKKKISRRGEIATRNFGLKHYEELAVAIALPGTAGEAIDWLDILLRGGAEAVCNGILAAALFVPTQKEIDERKRNLEQADEIERIEKLYPLPVMNALKFEYAATPAGKIMVFHRGVNEKGKEFFVPVSTPFGVPARLRYLDDADAYGLRCHVQDMNGVCRPIDLERCKLAKNAGADIREMLFKAGLRTEGAGEMIVIAALKAADPGQEILIVKRPGWHAIAGCPHQIFVAPDGEVIGAPEGLNLELAQSAKIPPGIAKSGDLEGWRATVGIAISAENTPHWTLGILAGFAAPFLSLAGLDTCGISLSGRTTLGKTLAERLGVSAWSLADLTRKSSLLQSARTTDNSAEARAQLSNGSIFALDELAHVDGRTLSKMIYTFAGGVGKSRMNQSADLRDSYHWTTFVILSCEISLDEKIRGDGGDWAGGMAVRFPDIDVTGVNGAVDREIITRVENDLHRHHGHAGPAFVRALVAHGLHQDPSALRERIATMARRLVDGANDEPDDANDDNSPDRNAYGAMTRAALPLAVLAAAGELARQFGLIPAKTPVTEAVQWAWNQFKKSSGAEILQPEEQAIANLRGWTLERWDVTVKPLDREKDNNRETLGWYDENAVYIPRKQIFEACGKIIKESHIGAMLHRRELLHATDRDRFTLKWVPRLGKNIVYALVFEEVGCEAKPKAEPEPQNRFFNGAYRWGRTG